MTEADFCQRLRTWAESLGFTVYPEVSSWDLILVPEADAELTDGNTVKAGEQVGVHAKLRANCEVLSQALPGHYRGPAFPMVAAPKAGVAFRVIAQRLRIGVITDAADGEFMVPVWPSRNTEALPLPLPPIAAEGIVAGAKSPRVLSPWRVKALRFLAWARTQDTFTLADLKRFGIHRRFADQWGNAAGSGWLQNVRGSQYRATLYRLTAEAGELPDFGYEGVAAELAAADAASPPAGSQGVLV